MLPILHKSIRLKECGSFTRNQFDLCQQAILKETDVNKTCTINMCAAVGEESASGEQLCEV